MSRLSASVPPRLPACRRTLFVQGLIGLLLSAGGIAPAIAQTDIELHTASAEMVWRGTQALKICNGLFTSNRSLDQIYQQELTGLRVAGPTPRSQLEVDRERRAVAVGVGNADGIPPMRSAYREGLGCIVMGWDQTFEDVDELPSLGMEAEAGDPATIPWPDGDLVSDQPLPSYVDGAVLNAAGDWAFDRVGHGGHEGQVTNSLVVVHAGNIIYERYAPGFDVTTKTRTWSTAKSVASTVVGIAVGKGLLKLDEPLPVDWLPSDGENDASDLRREITLRDVLHMSSGLYPMDDEWNHVRGSHMVYFGGWDAAYHPRDRGLRYEPGTVYNYENYDTLLGLHALKNAIGDEQTYREFPHRELLRRVGMRNTIPGMDRFGNYVMSSQIYTNARDLARFGLLYLNGGVWNGEQVVPREWVDFVRTPAPSVRQSGNEYGGQFWLVPDDRTELPQDAYGTSGAQGQYTIIVPSYDLVIVRRGMDWRQGSPGRGLDNWDLLAEVLEAFEPREGGAKLSSASP